MEVMTRKIMGLLFFLVFALQVGQAQKKIEFTASIDAKQVTLGSYFEVTFVLTNANGDDFTPPSFKDFNQRSGQNLRTSASAINGVWKRAANYSYYLSPKKVGKYKIGAASVRVGNKVLKTKPLEIEVVKGKPAKNAKGANGKEDVKAQLESQVFLKAELNTTEAYIGQQLLLDYKIYTAIGLDNYSVQGESDYAGFFAQGIRQFPSTQVKVVIEGVQYVSKVIKRVALFPQQTGALEIDPMLLRVSVATGKARHWLSYGSFVNHDITSEPLAIVVKNLPVAAPISFSGAVGKYGFKTQIDRQSLSTDDAFTLQLTTTGNGDIKRVRAPKLMLSDSFEVYEPRVIEDASYESAGQMMSRKTFEYLILPRYADRYSFQPEFTYFDADSLAYVRLLDKNYPLFVKQGNKAPKNIDDDLNRGQEDIRDIKLQTSLASIEHASFFGTKPFWVLMFLPFLFLGGVFVYKKIAEKRSHIDVALAKQKRAQKVAKKHLSVAEKHLKKGESRPFYDEVSRAMLGYVCDKLKMDRSDLTKDNVKEQLQSLSVSKEHIGRFMSVIQNCEMALFAGKDGSTAMKETYTNAIKTVSEIEGDLAK